MGIVLLGGLLFLVILVIVAPRINELFLISVREGRALPIRGKVPPALFRDLEDIITRSRVERATIRAVKSETHARLIVTGTDENVAQRLRNTFGIHPISKLRKASISDADRNFGQLLGWTWLAWLLSSRRRQ